VSEHGMAMPPQMVLDWIDVAVRYVKAGGIGCPECRDGIPSDAAKRGHDRHPKDCKGALERVFGAYEVKSFLVQPAECWFGMVSAPEDASAAEGG
jgi:hypothetical protein